MSAISETVDAGQKNSFGHFAPKDVIRVDAADGAIVFEQVIEAEAV